MLRELIGAMLIALVFAIAFRIWRSVANRRSVQESTLPGCWSLRVVLRWVLPSTSQQFLRLGLWIGYGLLVLDPEVSQRSLPLRMESR